jgi:hypothetical protein
VTVLDFQPSTRSFTNALDNNGGELITYLP